MGDETARGRRRFGKYRSFRDFFEEAERERGREGEDRRKKNGYSVIHVGRGVRIATREGKKRGETINRLVCEEDWYVMILA